MAELFENKLSGAEFSECRNYRYALWRIWDESLPLVMFIGLNPSTANEATNDQTISRVISISKFNGFGGVYMMNCFPYISTNPDALKDFDKTVYQQHQFVLNNQKLKEVAAKCSCIVFAFGNFKIIREVGRDKELFRVFPKAVALKVNKNGSPKHPLYCPKESKFVNYDHP